MNQEKEFEIKTGLILGLRPANQRRSYCAPSQWETSLQSNFFSHRLGANLESAMKYTPEATCKENMPTIVSTAVNADGQALLQP